MFRYKQNLADLSIYVDRVEITYLSILGGKPDVIVPYDNIGHVSAISWIPIVRQPAIRLEGIQGGEEWQEQFEVDIRDSPDDIAEILTALMRANAAVRSPEVEAGVSSMALSPRHWLAPAPITMRPNNMPYLHVYENNSANDCGQAAMAMVADHLGLEIPGLQRTRKDCIDKRMHWPNDLALSWFERNSFGPDNPFGMGTSGGCIVRALQHLKATSVVCGYQGLPGGQTWQQCWSSVKASVRRGYVVPVCIGVGQFPEYYGGGFLGVDGAHWPVLYAFNSWSVWLANMGGECFQVKTETFLSAWDYLGVASIAAGFSHCYVTAQGPLAR